MTTYENRQRWDLGAWPEMYWAATNLGPVGWDIGKHVGHAHELRSGPPGR